MASCLLTDQPVELANVPRIEDIDTMAAMLRDLGVGVDQARGSIWRLRANQTPSVRPDPELARRLRGSVLMLGPLLARTGEAVIPRPGGDDIGLRRLDQHLVGLRAMGATVEIRDNCYVANATLPLHGARVDLDMPTVTGTENLMMAATLADGQTTISNAAREPHIADLAHALNTMGARISGAGSDRIEVEGVARLGAGNHRVCPDYLEAGTYAIAVAATGGEVMLVDFPAVDLRSLVTKLRMAGVLVEVEAEGVRVRREGPIRPVDLITWTHPGFATDLQPQYTALMTQAAGTSVIQEFLFENRFNYVSELNALGANIELFPHRRGIRVHGPSALRGNAVTIPDIRAGAALMIGAMCAGGGTTLSGVEHLDRGYEDMAGKLSQLGAQVREGAVRAVDSPGEAIAGAE
jgi:UDP-N-acetylglucosamine 1-carboxyvinyltransferase